jgi:type I restriction enzyme S subunit
LTAVDERIDILTRRVELLKRYKTGVAEALFSRRLRLADFSGNWERKKLGDITDIRTGNQDVQDKVDDGKYPFFVRSEKVERINSYSYDGEAILIPGEGNIGKIFHYINGKFNFHQRVYKISDFIGGVYGKYIYYNLLVNFEREAMKNSVKATVDSLRLPTFKNFEIELPNIEEQEKIATFLSKIDEKIKVESGIISSVTEFKKSLLQRMFV